MAAPTFVGSTQQNNIYNGYGGSGKVNLPAAAQAGDLAVMALGTAINSGNSGSFPAPDGSTYYFGWEVSNNPKLYHRLWAKVITAADVANGGVPCSWSFDNGANAVMTTTVWRGATISVNAYSSDSSGSVSAFPAVTTTRNGCRFVDVIFGRFNTGDYGAAYYGNESGRTIRESGRAYCPPVGQYERTATSGAAGAQPSSVSSQGSSNNYVTLALYANNLPDAPAWKDAGGTADGATVSRAVDTPLAWTPADSDGDAQVGYDFRYRAFGTSGPWTTISRPAAGATAAGTIPAGTLSGRCAVQVRTYDAVGAGAWSADRLIIALDAVGAASTVPSKLDPGMLLALAQVQRLLVPAVT